MTNKEFSDEFSTLLNSFDIFPNITLDEYEKSVYLTQAQEQIVLELYNGLNTLQSSFEETEENRRLLDNLLVTTNIKKESSTSGVVSNHSSIYKKPKDLWFITYEVALLKTKTCSGKQMEALIIPTTQDEFYTTVRNPFRGVSASRVLRLDKGEGMIELVSKYEIETYTMRYLKQPRPIILIELLDLTVDGEKEESTCELNPMLHRAILERAVQIALIKKTQLSGQNKDKNKD